LAKGEIKGGKNKVIGGKSHPILLPVGEPHVRFGSKTDNLNWSLGVFNTQFSDCSARLRLHLTCTGIVAHGAHQ
jgi:hypothetical protein